MARLELSGNAITLLERRYLRKDDKRRVIERPDDLFLRVASNIASAEMMYSEPDLVERHLKRSGLAFWNLCRNSEFASLMRKDPVVKQMTKDFYELMTSLDFLPNSPCLYNAGQTFQQLAACFVIPIEDSMHSIFQGIYHTALIHQSGGGTGFNFSRLRPYGSLVKATMGEASGPVNFMQIYDAATEQIKQGGRRQGANMGILSVHHPDIIRFITAKSDSTLLKNFNISVAATDSFMKAVRNDWAYPLIHPRDGRVVERPRARKIFKLICQMAWQYADPGMVFIDTINKHNPTPKLGAIESTNPCGEMPLLPYEACNLGSINLAHMVKDGTVDWEKLQRTAHLAIRFLDNMIDMCNYPLPEIAKAVLGNRKIGLGVMGFAEMLYQLGLSYASAEARELGGTVMKFINTHAKMASVELAKVRGVFSNFKGSVYDTGRREDRLRNATRTTISPTGSISVIAGCSSGIEPLFALAYTKTMLSDNHVIEYNKHFKVALKKEGLYSAEILEKVAKRGTVGNVGGVPESLRRVFVTATEVSPEDHIKMQAAFQDHIDNGVSKTVNLPRDATIKDVENVFLLAWELGCKGTTVYRYGSLDDQVQTMGIAKR